MLLAAQLAGDRCAVVARSALAGAVGERLGVRAEALEALAPQVRAEALRATAAELRGVSPERVARFAPRARALLAAEVPRSIGSVWQRDAPPVRRGFAASAGVRAAVRAVASEVPLAADLELAARELGRGRALLARATAALEADVANALIETLDAAEAGAVLALRELLGASDGAADVLADALLDAARRTVQPRELVRALGAMALAIEGDGSPGDARSHDWRRVAREVAAVEGHVRAESPGGGGDATR